MGERSDTLETGILRLAEKTYDAIIFDLGLPNSTGIKTFESLKAQAKSVPIIILSGNDHRSVLTEVMKAGASVVGGF